MTRHGFETFPHECLQDYTPLNVPIEKLVHRRLPPGLPPQAASTFRSGNTI